MITSSCIPHVRISFGTLFIRTYSIQSTSLPIYYFNVHIDNDASIDNIIDFINVHCKIKQRYTYNDIEYRSRIRVSATQSNKILAEAGCTLSDRACTINFITTDTSIKTYINLLLLN